MIYFQRVIAILNTSVTFAPPCTVEFQFTDEYFPPHIKTMYYRHGFSGFSMTNETTRAVIEREVDKISKKYYPKKDCSSKIKRNQRNSLNLEQMQIVFLIFLGISTLSVGFLIMEIGAQNLSSSGSSLDRKNSSRLANLALFQLEIEQATDKYLRSDGSGKSFASELLITCGYRLEHETRIAYNSNIHMSVALSLNVGPPEEEDSLRRGFQGERDSQRNRIPRERGFTEEEDSRRTRMERQADEEMDQDLTP